MIKAKIGNLLESIESEKLDGIMNAANGIGPMGKGIAGAIRKYGGVQIQDDAFNVCKEKNPQPGESYSTIPGQLKVKRIIHAVTMKKPGGPTSYDIISNAFKAALKQAKEEGITKIGCTALGTASGGLDPIIVAKKMVPIAWNNEDINVLFMDIDKTFINEVQKQLALSYAFSYGSIDGNHHKMWVIDQIVQSLTGDEYEKWIKEFQADEDGAETYIWDKGIAP